VLLIALVVVMGVVVVLMWMMVRVLVLVVLVMLLPMLPVHTATAHDISRAFGVAVTVAIAACIRIKVTQRV